MKPSMLTQAGKAKAIGSKSWLAQLKPPTAAQRVHILSAIKSCAAGKFGWRSLKTNITKALQTKMKIYEAVRRLAKEFLM